MGVQQCQIIGKCKFLNETYRIKKYLGQSLHWGKNDVYKFLHSNSILCGVGGK